MLESLVLLITLHEGPAPPRNHHETHPDEFHGLSYQVNANPPATGAPLERHLPRREGTDLV